MTTVVRSGFIVRHRLYALVGLLSLRQFPVHWERNENSMQFRKPIVWVNTVAGRIGVRPIVLRKQRLAKLKGEPPPSVPFVSASARIPKSEALSVKEIEEPTALPDFENDATCQKQTPALPRRP